MIIIVIARVVGTRRRDLDLQCVGADRCGTDWASIVEIRGRCAPVHQRPYRATPPEQGVHELGVTSRSQLDRVMLTGPLS
ncbi:hypothetical protein [Mycolicibacterium sediminis]|uniref:hypothetical protein n=1 Tax=Mycolicibacterium sediminis TaxID=1286180 RepID=UPI0013D77FD5|nr:hypothetical protein [Mycolicibacterium sediminis]